MVRLVQLDQHVICVVSSQLGTMVAERLFGWSSIETTCSRHGQPASGLSQKQSGVHPWRQSRQEAASPSGGMADGDSTKVVYKIRQGSLSGATVVPVLNVSSRIFWLELEDKALLDSYTVLQEGILCDVFAEMLCCMAGRPRSTAHGRYYVAGPSRCR